MTFPRSNFVAVLLEENIYVAVSELATPEGGDFYCHVWTPLRKEPDHPSSPENENAAGAAWIRIATLTNPAHHHKHRTMQTAKTILIPKPGKPPSIENLRPISLTSCVGKVLEHVLNNRWQRYLEGEGLYPDTMLGFRERLSTQDAMILLQQDILDTSILPHDNKAVLGLDLQSAFDKRTVEIQAGDQQLPVKELGSVGTPQGSVISPLLFNLVMIGVAERLSEIPEVRYTIYADDITLWVPGGSDGHIETTLQTAVYVIENHLANTGLRCSPQKSELLIIPPPGRYRKKAEEESTKITIRTRDGTVIPKVQTLRVLGMTLEASRSNGTTVDRITTKLGIATRLIKRITTRHHGMKEASLLRLIQSFAMSHVAYVGAFHQWKKHESDRINAAIRKTYKAALGLLNSTSTDRLLELGLHNTLEEISEAQRMAQLERLSTIRTGRRILERLGLGPKKTETHKARGLPLETLQRLKILPLPRNVHPDYNPGRRAARARALTETHANDTGAIYVDVAKYPDRPDTYATVAVRATTGEVYSACSVRVPSAQQAEEVAIALALTNPQCTTILSDSRSAIANFAKDKVCTSAVRVVQCCAVNSESVPATHIRWFPAHMNGSTDGSGHPNRNETADAAARALTNRAAPPRISQAERQQDSDQEPLVTYAEILQWYRLGRQLRPPPHPKLTRAEAVLYRQLQTNSVITPVLAQYVCPEVYESVLCSVCAKTNATLAHLLWDCELNPVEATASTRWPDDITSAMDSSDHYVQLRAVQRLEAALAGQKRREAPTGGLRDHTRRPSARRPRRRPQGVVSGTT
ncbi:uncharacterized protein LOC144155642 [Haemaphysalis longicornis]